MDYPKQHIHIISMGGTIDFIDPNYDELNTKLLRMDRDVGTYLEEIIQPHFTFSEEVIVKKDSRDITEEDRMKLLSSITNSSHEKILITHGTYTINTTGIYLQDHQEEFSHKTISLTASMIPLWGFMTTDASFNLGFAVASLKILSPGVYVSMNGENFDPRDIHKNLDDLSFELK